MFTYGDRKYRIANNARILVFLDPNTSYTIRRNNAEDIFTSKTWHDYHEYALSARFSAFVKCNYHITLSQQNIKTLFLRIKFIKTLANDLQTIY